MTRVSVRRVLFQGVGLLLAFLHASAAQAGPEWMSYNGSGAGLAVHVDYELAGHPAFSGWVFAGQLNATLYTGPQFSNPFSFRTFCVDFDHEVHPGQTYLVSPQSTAVGLNNGDKIAYLYRTFGQGPLTNAQAAALQLAIWDELIDRGHGSTPGGLVYTIPNSEVGSLLTSYLHSAAGQSATGTWLDSNASVGVPGVQVGQGFLAPVPEPNSLLLLLVGMVGLGGYGAWRRMASAGQAAGRQLPSPLALLPSEDC